MDHNGYTPEGDRFGATTFADDSAAPKPNMTHLVGGILDDAKTLFKQQVVLLKAEVKEDIKKTVAASKFIAMGAGLAVFGAFFFLMGLPLLLNWLVPALPLWACWFIIGGTLLLVGGVSAFVGYKKMTSFNPLPDKSLHALQENISCLTNQPK